MNKTVYILLIALGLTLTGCAGQKPQDENTITVWHWMSDREIAFETLASRYEEETGIRVKFDLYAPSETYSQKVKAAAQTSTLPDVFGILGKKKDFASYVKAGYVADLTEAVDASGFKSWMDTLFGKAVAVNRFLDDNEYGVPPGIYGVPLDVTTIQMVYNKSLLSQAGLDPEDPPRTWEEFLRVSRILKENNIPVFVGGFGEIWMLDALSSNFAMNLMGEDKVFATYRGDVSYTDPDWVHILDLFKQMADNEIMVLGAVTMVNKTAEQTFANERAAFAFNGSWCVNVYEGMNPDLQYGAMLPPLISSLNPMKIWGGAGSSFMVNKRSSRKDKAIDFLKWLSSKNQQVFLANETNNLPANRSSLKNVSPILAQFADDIDNTTHPNIYPVHEFPTVAEAWSKGIQSILIGEKTPEQVAKEVQRKKDKELAKRRT